MGKFKTSDNEKVDASFESESEYVLKDLINKIIGEFDNKFESQHKILKSSWFNTQLGSMLVIADEEGIYLLEFAERKGLDKEIKKLKNTLRAKVVPSRNKWMDLVEQEISEYFAGKLRKFNTPIYLMGSSFQKAVWQELMKIPYGETRSYMQQAHSVNMPKSYRAVANANGSNQLAIIVPCHRIINNNGNLGGYGGGISRKKWLIEHEKRN